MTPTVRSILQDVHSMNPIMKRLIFCSFLVAYNITFSDSEQTGIILEADETVYDDNKSTVTMKGNATMKGTNLTLQAEEVLWNRKTSMVFANGNVMLGLDDFRLLASSLTLDFSNGTFSAYKIRTGYYPWTIDAEDITSNNMQYSFSNAQVMHENHERFSPNLMIERLEFDKNSSSLSGKGVGIKIGDTYIGKLPEITKNLNNFSSRYELLGGQQNPLGWYGGLRIDLQGATPMQFELQSLYYLDRGLYLSPNFQYLSPNANNSKWFNLNINLAAIRDSGVRGLDYRGQEIKKNRGLARIASSSKWDDNWKFNFSANPQTDSEFYRDFERENFLNYQWIDNFAELVYDGDILTASLLSDWQVNEYESQIEKKPKLQILLGPKVSWNSNFHETIKLEYAKRNDLDNFGELLNKSESIDLSLKSQGVYKVGKGFIYSPALTYKRQDYMLGSHDSPVREFSEVSNEIKFLLVADQAYSFPMYEGMMDHFSTFSLKHNHVHQIRSRNDNSIPSIEGNFLNPNIEHMNLFDFSDYDDLSPYEVLRFSWSNSFIGAYEKNIFHEFAALKLEQDIWTDKSSEFMPDPHFLGSISLSPFPSMEIEYTKKIKTSNGITAAEFMSLYLRDGWNHEFIISNISIPSIGSNLSFYTKSQISLKTALALNVRYDPENHNFSYWSGDLHITKPVGWEWVFSLSKYQGSRKEDNLSWGLRANIFSF